MISAVPLTPHRCRDACRLALARHRPHGQASPRAVLVVACRDGGPWLHCRRIRCSNRRNPWPIILGRIAMGALFEGFDAARRKQEAQVIEHHRKEMDIDDHLQAVATMLDQDIGFLKEREFTHDTVHRILRLNHRNSPVITVHFATEEKAYIVTFMRDGTKRTITGPEECAKAIGEMIFSELGVK
jgi:hypothetical protein